MLIPEAQGRSHIPSESRDHQPLQNQVMLAWKKRMEGFGVGDNNINYTQKASFLGAIQGGGPDCTNTWELC